MIDFKVPNIAKSRLESKLTKEKVQQTRNDIILSVKMGLKRGESNLSHTDLKFECYSLKPGPPQLILGKQDSHTTSLAVAAASATFYFEKSRQGT